MMVLIAILGVQAFMDWKLYRISNWSILLGILAGFILYPNAIPLSLIQMLVIFILFFSFYKLKGLGAGDIKLLMMLACFFQKEVLFYKIAGSFLVAAVLSILKIIGNSEARQRVVYGFGYVKKAVITKTLDPYQCNKTNKKTVIPFAVPVFFWICIGELLL